MKFLVKFIVLLLVFLISLLAFSPKESLYNYAEKEISKQNIIVSNESRQSGFFNLSINDAEVYYDGLFTAYIKNSDIFTLLVYSNIEIKDIRVSKSFENILPSKIVDLNLKHSILEFNKLKLKSRGDFGEFNGEILLLDRKIVGVLKPSNIMKSKYRKLLSNFKLVEGEYKYEFKF